MAGPALFWSGVLTLVALAIAGCSSGMAPPQGTAAPTSCAARVLTEGPLDLITPGCWHVTSNTDNIMAWVHNPEVEAQSFKWSLTGAGKTALPQGWQVAFAPESGSLAKAGDRTQGRYGWEYNDWKRTHISLTIPADTPKQSMQAELHAGQWTKAITIIVEGDRGRVSKAGDAVSANYKGTFQDNGEKFDEGNFPLTLGEGRAVAGFDYGLMGLALNEKAALVIPAAFHYGYDNQPSQQRDLTKFNGRVLIFDVEIKAFNDA